MGYSTEHQIGSFQSFCWAWVYGWDIAGMDTQVASNFVIFVEKWNDDHWVCSRMIFYSSAWSHCKGKMMRGADYLNAQLVKYNNCGQMPLQSPEFKYSFWCFNTMLKTRMNVNGGSWGKGTWTWSSSRDASQKYTYLELNNNASKLGGNKKLYTMLTHQRAQI